MKRYFLMIILLSNAYAYSMQKMHPKILDYSNNIMKEKLSIIMSLAQHHYPKALALTIGAAAIYGMYVCATDYFLQKEPIIITKRHDKKYAIEEIKHTHVTMEDVKKVIVDNSWPGGGNISIERAKRDDIFICAKRFADTEHDLENAQIIIEKRLETLFVIASIGLAHCQSARIDLHVKIPKKAKVIYAANS